VFRGPAHKSVMARHLAGLELDLCVHAHDLRRYPVDSCCASLVGFTDEELQAYFATATRIGVTGHVCTEEQYETMRDAGAFDEDVVTGATDALLFERARELLLGGAALDDLR